LITGIQLVRYRGFERFEVRLTPHAFLVGPNSAGKSTIIEALALAEQCLRIARRRAPSLPARDRGRSVRAYPLPASDVDGVDPVHFDFTDQEACVDVGWASGSRLHLVWPAEMPDEFGSAHFWLEYPDGMQPRQAAVPSLYPELRIVPVITPLDNSEELKNEKYISRMASTRLASRHFRNHMLVMSRSGELADFLDFARPWIPEMQVQDVVLDAGADRLGMFYSERRSRIPKELAWAGDGLQIWLQLLWHIYRAQGASTIVLDEPEVYLHPDLQRRLVRLLDDLDAQVILASHSSEIVTEAPQDSVVWIDRSSTRGRRVNTPATLSSVTDALGTNYNLALVRSSRSRVVLAAEMDDMRALRMLARAVGASSIFNENDVVLVPLRSFASWASAEPLVWISREILSGTSAFAVFLNGDSRPVGYNLELASKLTANGIYCHIWPWRELLNSLLVPSILARASGAGNYAIADKLNALIEEAAEESRDKYLAEAARFTPGDDVSANASFREQWATAIGRLRLISGRRLLDELNDWLESGGYRKLTARSMAQAANASELPLDVITAIQDVEELAQGGLITSPMV
jgi:hypothetical protein